MFSKNSKSSKSSKSNESNESKSINGTDIEETDIEKQIEKKENKECRICYQGDKGYQGDQGHLRDLNKGDQGLDKRKDKLIHPCMCNGTIAYVHRKCLDDWRATSFVHMNKCSTCNFEYEIVIKSDVNKLKKITYCTLISVNLSLFLFVLSSLFAFVGFITYMCDLEPNNYQNGLNLLIPSKFYANHLLYFFLIGMSLEISGIIMLLLIIAKAPPMYNNFNFGGDISGTIWIIIFFVLGTIPYIFIGYLYMEGVFKRYNHILLDSEVSRMIVRDLE